MAAGKLEEAWNGHKVADIAFPWIEKKDKGKRPAPADTTTSKPGGGGGGSGGVISKIKKLKTTIFSKQS